MVSMGTPTSDTQSIDECNRSRMAETVVLAMVSPSVLFPAVVVVVLLALRSASFLRHMSWLLAAVASKPLSVLRRTTTNRIQKRRMPARRTTSSGQSFRSRRCQRTPLSQRPPVSRSACTPPPGLLHHPPLLPPGFVQAHSQTLAQVASTFCRQCSAMLSSLSASLRPPYW